MSQPLPDTQTPASSCLTQPSQIVSPSLPWGKLFSTFIRLTSYELVKDSFSFGRSADCDLVAEERIFLKNTLSCISKIHFIITKESEDIAVIQDLSKNGTWVNGNLIGKGNTLVLQDGDEISVGKRTLKIFHFKLFKLKDDFLPKELHKKYETSKTLGGGAFGEVKLVFTKRNCSPYAVKKIAKEKLSNLALTVRMSNYVRNEMNILRSLAHPFVISMKEIVETDNAFFIVLEYMEGGTLQERIMKRDTLSESEVKLLFTQIVLAVKYLHDNEITHRDLKPDNVLLASNQRETIVKVTDFGLSKITKGSTLLKTQCGTPYYIAPEILNNDHLNTYTKQVDIWSCGVILYFMFSQELPFRALDGNLGVLFKLIATGKYTLSGEKWNNISILGIDLLRKMITVNPEERIKSKEILEHPWILKDEEMKETLEKLVPNFKFDYYLECPVELPLKRPRNSNGST